MKLGVIQRTDGTLITKSTYLAVDVTGNEMPAKALISPVDVDVASAGGMCCVDI
jgi:hypothetical protein